MQQKIQLNKNIFGVKGTLDYLDEEFSEFIIKKYTPEEFFELYGELFYDIPKEGRLSHTTIVSKSTEYAGTPPNPKDQTIIDLKEQVEEIKIEIDSIEEEHNFLPNHTVLQVRNESSLKYYMHSGKRRQIKNDNVINYLKIQKGTPESTPDEEFAVLLNADAIASIPAGPDINSEEDLNIDVYKINRFTQGVDPNSPLTNIAVAIPQPDLRTSPITPETNNYNPMINIDEPSPNPASLILGLPTQINTNSFEGGKQSVNEWKQRQKPPNQPQILRQSPSTTNLKKSPSSIKRQSVSVRDRYSNNQGNRR